MEKADIYLPPNKVNILQSDYDLEDVPILVLFKMEELDSEYYSYSDKFVRIVTKRGLDYQPTKFALLPVKDINFIVRSTSREESVDLVRQLVERQIELGFSASMEECKKIVADIEQGPKVGLFGNFQSLTGVEKAIETKNLYEVSRSISASYSATVDIRDIEYCRTASLKEIRSFLSEISPFEQAMYLVLLEHFRPEFFSVNEQLETQKVVDLTAANEIVEQLNSALMFSGSSYSSNPAERALIKYFILLLVRDGNGIVNLRGEHYKGWISIKGIVSSPKGEILKMIVDINPLRKPLQLDHYY